MDTAEIIAKANEIAENEFFEFIGIRTQYEPFEMGEIDHVSHVWVDGEDTGEELPGICATNVSANNAREIGYHADGYYFGEHTALIAGNYCEYGEDAGEIIIKDAQVVYIIR